MFFYWHTDMVLVFLDTHWEAFHFESGRLLQYAYDEECPFPPFLDLLCEGRT